MRIANWPPEPIDDPAPPTEYPELKAEFERLVGCYGLVRGFQSYADLALRIHGDAFPPCPETLSEPQFHFNVARTTCPALIEVTAIHLLPQEEIEYHVARVDRSGLDIERTTANASGIIDAIARIPCLSAGEHRIELVRPRTGEVLATTMVETTIDFATSQNDPDPGTLPPQGSAAPAQPSATPLAEGGSARALATETPRTDTTAAARNVAAAVVVSVVLGLGAAAAVGVAARRRGRS